MPFLQANGISIYYECIGKGEPIVLLSGFATHHETWYKFTDRLSKKYQLILMDNRGSGQSEAPLPPYTIEMMGDDTIQLMDALNISKAHMIGSSMGSAIVQTIALKYPERLEKAILISPFAKLPLTSLLKSEIAGEMMQAGVPYELVVKSVLPWLFSNDFLADPEKVKQKIFEMTKNPYPQKPEGYLGQLMAMQTFDIQEKIEKIQTKMLLIAGEEDLSTPLHCATFIHKKVKNSTLKTFPLVGHMAHAEKKEEVLDMIEAFLF